MKKKITISITIILLIFIGIILYIFFTKGKETENYNGRNIATSSNKESNYISENVSDNIQERNYKKIGNNLYYEDELIETKGTKRKETILDYYKIISSYIEKKSPYINLFIYNFNYDKSDNTTYFYCYQMINMVIIEDVAFTLFIKDDDISDYIYFINDSNFINTTIDTTNIININDAEQKALDIAKENRNEIFSSDSDSDTIQGKCYLTYSDNNLCYNVDMNNGSYVKIDAITGEIVDTYFWDGLPHGLE